jgi:hypothetical protein
MKRLGFIFVLELSMFWMLTYSTAQAEHAKPGTTLLNVDLTDASRRIIHLQLSIPASPGPIRFVYPKWTQGHPLPD